MANGSRLLALLGVGALAYWRYTKSTPEEKQKVKDTLDNAKKNLSDMGGKLKDQANSLKDQVTKQMGGSSAQTATAGAGSSYSGSSVNPETPTATQEGDYYQSQSQNN